MMIATTSQTLVDALSVSFETSLRTADGVAKPIALLWADADSQWRPLVPILQKTLPCLFVLGEYDPQARRGPVIWLKCVVDRTLPEIALAHSSRSLSCNIAARRGISAMAATGAW